MPTRPTRTIHGDAFRTARRALRWNSAAFSCSSVPRPVVMLTRAAPPCLGFLWPSRRRDSLTLYASARFPPGGQKVNVPRAKNCARYCWVLTFTLAFASPAWAKDPKAGTNTEKEKKPANEKTEKKPEAKDSPTAT